MPGCSRATPLRSALVCSWPQQEVEDSAAAGAEPRGLAAPGQRCRRRAGSGCGARRRRTGRGAAGAAAGRSLSRQAAAAAMAVPGGPARCGGRRPRAGVEERGAAGDRSAGVIGCAGIDLAARREDVRDRVEARGRPRPVEEKAQQALSEAGLRLNTRFLGWGTMFLDVDNDGRLDIFSVNGHVYPEVDTAHLGSSYKEPRLLYWNSGDGKFKDISEQCGPGCFEPRSSRGLAVADFWNDGRLSVAVNNMNDESMLLVNEARSQNHWLGVITRGTKSNRDGIGAKVMVVANDHKYEQEVRSGSSYISNNDMRLHFGLGSSAVIGRIEVRWPNGDTETFPGGAADRFITLLEGRGQNAETAHRIRKED